MSTYAAACFHCGETSISCLPTCPECVRKVQAASDVAKEHVIAAQNLREQLAEVTQKWLDVQHELAELRK